jgi:hypothetical protein
MISLFRRTTLASLGEQQNTSYDDQSDKISHVDIEDDGIDTVPSHIDIPYPILISRVTIAIWWMTVFDHIDFPYLIYGH